MAQVVLDTDVASRLMKGTLPPRLLSKLVGHQYAITFITDGELRRWPIIRDWGEARVLRFEAWLKPLGLVVADDAVSRTWAEITGYAIKRGRPSPVNDSWIAACCLAYDLPLATLNIPDFQDFAQHEGLELIIG